MKNKKEYYGWDANGIDTHIMKNIEWGVVAYLSKSSYGKSDRIWRNNSLYIKQDVQGTLN
jgi:hypothetical protein